MKKASAPIAPEVIVSEISANRNQLKAALAEIYADNPPAGYALPMAWRFAVEMSGKLVDHIPRYSSADHGSILKSLLRFVVRTLERPNSPFKVPFFDVVIEHDPSVERCLEAEREQVTLLNFELSLTKRYWRLHEISADFFLISLAPSQRRSALILLDHKAEYLASSEKLKKIFDERNLVALTIETGMREVLFLKDAVPDAWAQLMEQVGFSIDDVLPMQAFVQWLLHHGRLWFTVDELEDEYAAFAGAEKLPLIPRERFHKILDFFSEVPSTVESWGIGIPFVRMENWLVLWPYVHHILPPSLTFLSLLMRKRANEWNNTVGASLALAAQAIRKGLCERADLCFVTAKAKVNVGDIDLGIYDRRTRVLLLCEIKTVFDRFRTNYQQSNFVGQRVNFEKAASRWPLHEMQ